jgi:hypothetical protein
MVRVLAVRLAGAILLALPLLPICGFALNGSPRVVFFIGAFALFVAVQLLLMLSAIRSAPLPGAPPKPVRFTIRGLLCLTTVVCGATVFMASGFRCEAAERAMLPAPLPAATFRQFFWQLEAGLICVVIGGLIWTSSSQLAPMSAKREVI